MSMLQVVSFTMLGIGLVKHYLNDIVRWNQIKEVLDREVELAKKEIIRRAPKSTGLMEDWVKVRSASTVFEHIYMIYIPIGIDPDHPFYPLAMEFGTRRIDVGTPARPKGRWESKTKQGATMPFMRPAAVTLKKKALRAIKNKIMMNIRSKHLSAGFLTGSGQIKPIRRGM